MLLYLIKTCKIDVKRTIKRILNDSSLEIFKVLNSLNLLENKQELFLKSCYNGQIETAKYIVSLGGITIDIINRYMTNEVAKDEGISRILYKEHIDENKIENSILKKNMMKIREEYREKAYKAIDKYLYRDLNNVINLYI